MIDIFILHRQQKKEKNRKKGKKINSIKTGFEIFQLFFINNLNINKNFRGCTNKIYKIFTKQVVFSNNLFHLYFCKTVVD